MVACLVLPRSPAAVSGKHKGKGETFSELPAFPSPFPAAVMDDMQLKLGCSDGDVTKRRGDFTWCFTHLVASMICKGSVQLQVQPILQQVSGFGVVNKYIGDLRLLAFSSKSCEHHRWSYFFQMFVPVHLTKEFSRSNMCDFEVSLPSHQGI